MAPKSPHIELLHPLGLVFIVLSCGVQFSSDRFPGRLSLAVFAVNFLALEALLFYAWSNEFP